MNDTFLVHLSLVSPLVAGFLAIFFLLHRRNPANVFLGLSMAILAIILMGRYLFSIGSAALPFLPFIVFPLACFHGPLLIAYVSRFLEPSARNGKWFLSSSVLSLIAVLTHGAIMHYLPESRESEAIVAQEGALGFYTAGFVTVLMGFEGLCLTVAVRQVQWGSSRLQKLQLHWLRLFLSVNAACAMVYLMLACLTWLGFLSGPFHVIEILLATAVLFLLLHFLLRHPEVLNPGKAEPMRYAKQSLTPDDAKRILQDLQDFMIQEKPYLQDDMSLNRLAEETGVPAHHLSMAINGELSMNFFAFMNEYRVKEAITLMNKPDYRDHTLLAIAFEAGFQSKAAFNSAFKKYTGMAPGDFRKKLSVQGDGPGENDRKDTF